VVICDHQRIQAADIFQGMGSASFPSVKERAVNIAADIGQQTLNAVSLACAS